MIPMDKPLYVRNAECFVSVLVEDWKNRENNFGIKYSSTDAPMV